MPNDNEDNLNELRPSTKKLENAGLCSHPDYENNKIKLPNLWELLGML